MKGIFKSGLAVLLFGVVACFALGSSVFAAGVVPPVSDGFALSLSKQSFTVKAGESVVELIDISNASGDVLEDVSVWASGGLGAFMADGRIGGYGKGSFALSIYTSAAATGDMTGDVTISYTQGGVPYTQTFVVVVKVTPADAVPTPTPVPAPTPTPAPTPVPQRPALFAAAEGIASAKVGSPAKVSIKITNSSRFEAKAVTLTQPTAAGMAVTLSKGYIDGISANGSATVTATVTVDKSVTAGLHTMSVGGSFTSADGSYAGTFTANVSVMVSSSETPTPAPTIEPAQPIFTFGEIRSDDADVRAGAAFNLSGTITNHAKDAATAVKITIAPPTGLSGASSYDLYVGDVGGGETKNFTFKLKADDDAATGSYPVKFTLTAADAKGKAAQGAESSLSLKVTGKEKDKLTLAKVESVSVSNPSGSFDVGQEFTINMTIKNNGETKAENVTIKAVTPAGIVPKSANAAVVGELAVGESRTLGFTFAATADSSSQFYAVQFEVGYTAGYDDKNAAVAGGFSQYGGVNIVNSEKDKKENKEDEKAKLGKLSVVGSVMPQGLFDVNETFVVEFDIKNVGVEPVTDVKVEAKPEVANIAPKSAAVAQIASISAGGSSRVSFSFAPTAAADSRYHTIPFEIAYTAGTDKDGKSVTETFTFFGTAGVNNTEKDKKEETANKSVPKIIIDDYTVDSGTDTPEIVLAGQEFDLYIRFKNTHKVKTVQNVKVTLSTPPSGTGDKGNTFSVVGASNTIYIDSIPPEGTFEKSLRMYSILSAAAKNHIISVAFEYEDEDGNPYTQTEEVGVTVTQEAKLEVGNIYMPSMINIGDMSYLYFSLQNTGRVTLYNVKVYLEGEGFALSGSEAILGNMQSGGYQYYDGQFSGETEGAHTLKVVVQYDLDTGKRVVNEQSFDIEVVNGGGFNGGEMGFNGGEMSFDGGGMMPEETAQVTWYNPTTWPLWAKIAVPCAVVVVIGGIVTGVILTRRRKQRGSQEDYN